MSNLLKNIQIELFSMICGSSRSRPALAHSVTGSAGYLCNIRDHFFPLTEVNEGCSLKPAL